MTKCIYLEVHVSYMYSLWSKISAKNG
jgi:hypothetical protein